MKSKKQRPKIIVGLSGGVDSAVALLLLKKQGFEPTAVSLRFSGWSGADNIYSNQESFKIAEKVCRRLKVPFRIVDCRKEFKEKVIGYFLKELKQKRTPNPCVVCNHCVKFKNLLDFARKNKIKYVATGHYARIKRVCHCERPERAKQSHFFENITRLLCRFAPRNDKEKMASCNDNFCQYQLLKGKDKEKDQSYFLCLLTQKELSCVIFPLGDLTKKEVCRIAGKNGLDFVLKRKPSQDICFVSRKSLPLLLEKEIGIEPGEIIDTQDNVLGEHKGLHFYTIGQRRGLNIPNGPWRVLGLNKEKNQLIITDKEKDSGLYSRSAVVFPHYFISGKAPKQTIKARVKCRYNHPAASAILSLCHSERSEESRGKQPLLLSAGFFALPNFCKQKFGRAQNDKVVRIRFRQPQKAIAPGQWAVFYQGNVCLGGGIIKSTDNEK